MEKRLGKIRKATFGLGGYQDAMLGLHVSLESGATGVSDTKSYWDAQLIECSDSCKWTEADRDKGYAEVMRFVSKLLSDAKVSSVDQLAGTPIEVTYEGMMLKEWRVLTEVI